MKELSEIAFAPLLEELKTNRENVERTIIFCHTYDSAGKIYCFFKHGMGRESTKPLLIFHSSGL